MYDFDEGLLGSNNAENRYCFGSKIIIRRPYLYSPIWCNIVRKQLENFVKVSVTSRIILIGIDKIVSQGIRKLML